MRAGEAVRLEPTDRDGNPVSAAAVDFRVLGAAGTLEETEAGRWTAVAAGSATLVGSWGGARDTVRVTVLAETAEGALAEGETPPEDDEPDPAPLTLELGRSALAVEVGELIALNPRDAAGDPVDAGEIFYSWRGTSPGGGQVLEPVGGGRFRGRAPGRAVIVATRDEATDSVAVTVRAAPEPDPPPVTVAAVEIRGDTSPLAQDQERSLSVAALGPGGQPVADAPGPPVWSSSNPDVVRVADGRVSVAGPGDGAWIRATLAGRTDSVRISVTPVASELHVGGAPGTLEVGQTADLEVTVLDRFGEPMSADVACATARPGVLRVEVSACRVTGVSPGSATVTATVGGASGRVGFEVVAPPPAQPSPEEARGLARELIGLVEARDEERLRALTGPDPDEETRSFARALDDLQGLGEPTDFEVGADERGATFRFALPAERRSAFGAPERLRIEFEVRAARREGAWVLRGFRVSNAPF